MKTLRLGFAGFRHAHIIDLYQRAQEHPKIHVVGVWENDPRASLLPERNITRTHSTYEDLLKDCDALAIGDVYGQRGALVIDALRAGRHVIADKPLCTSLKELGEIECLAKINQLKIGMMLDLRDHGNLITLKSLLDSGRLGEIQTLAISAQHPLLLGRRPAWYFEPGQHGGTLNDIAIHALDFIPWLTGLDIAEVVMARTWNAKASEAPHFKDCGQFMLKLSNSGGVLGDVSYLAPDGCGYELDNYWRISVHGTRGFAETSYNRAGVTVSDDNASALETISSELARPGGYLEDFLEDISGRPVIGGRDTTSCLLASRRAQHLELKACQL